jgi:protein-disulfide isomerase
MNVKPALFLSLAALATLAIGCEDLKPIGARSSKSIGYSGSSSRGSEGSTEGKVKLELYVMSKCPFGVQAEQGLKPVLDEIGDRIDLHIDFIANEEGGGFGSLHGEPEVKGDIQQLCAMKLYPEMKRWIAFQDCVNKKWQQIPEGWESCAEQNGMDKGRLQSCIDGSQGKDLLRESAGRAKKANAQGSPTIVLAGEPYNGGRSKSDYMRALCEKLSPKPDSCTKIPEDVEVVATILTDKRCKACETEGLIANLRQRFFPKLKAKTIDYGDEEGKKLYKEMGLKLLPAMLFTKDVEKAERYQQIARWMEEKGAWKTLRIPATFDPTKEICDNGIDDTGDGRVDCDDQDCKGSLLCRKEVGKKLEVFVMSQCPYGVQALDAMKEVLGAFNGKVPFDVHFIADAQYDESKKLTGFNSLHGQAEVDEDIRELCAKKHYPRAYKWMDYIWCRNKEIRSAEWKGCAKDGIDAAVIEKCSTGDEGKKLLEEDVKLAKELEISGSPSWLANNKFKFSGIAADGIKSSFCEHNKGVEGCDKKLTEKAGAPSGSCGQ